MTKYLLQRWVDRLSAWIVLLIIGILTAKVTHEYAVHNHYYCNTEENGK